MASPFNSADDFAQLETAFKNIRLNPKMRVEIVPEKSVTAMSVRDAVFSPSEVVPVVCAEGRICAVPAVSCPPAIPIAVSGEVITPKHIGIFEHYGIKQIAVVKK